MNVFVSLLFSQMWTGVIPTNKEDSFIRPQMRYPLRKSSGFGLTFLNSSDWFLFESKLKKKNLLSIMFSHHSF